MRRNNTVWIVGTVLVVLAALGLWWVASNLSLDSSTPGFWNRQSVSETPEAANETAASQIEQVDRSNSDVASIVRNLSGASQFSSLFVSSGVAATINPNSVSEYTIFVPTNGAFAQLEGGLVANMSAAERERLVKYHVVSGRAIDVEALTAGSIEALSGDVLNFSFGEDRIPLVNSAIVITEYRGSNGTVYLIDNVLLPPRAQSS